jgi:hypothetical protein
MMEEASCQTCRFVGLHKDNDRLYICRKSFPLDTDASQRAIWPIVGALDWCGDYKKAGKNG